LISTGALRLHALLQGQGAPPVILEPALGGFALQYGRIQQQVAGFTRVLAYDRAGQGWSDPPTTPRTPQNMAAELFALLDRLDLPAPYLLVGHSFGGLLARCYAGLRPEAVAGLVLIDSSDVRQYESMPDMDKNLRQAAFGVRLMRLADRVGLARGLAKLSMASMAKSLSPADRQAFLEVIRRPGHQQAALDEFAQHRLYFGPQSQVPAPPANLPLVVITAGASLDPRQRMGKQTGAQINASHLAWQAELAGSSPRGRHIIVPGASHLSLLTNPEHVAVVVAAIRDVVEQARG
jgi:pimeloyl-ACP methyl ester carboxylesterase